MRKRVVRHPAFRVVVAVQGILQMVATIDLARQRQVRRAPKWVWSLVIMSFGYGGPIAYWLFGRPKD